MTDLHIFLAHVWFVLLVMLIALYAVFDGYELGIGIAMLLQRKRLSREFAAELFAVWGGAEAWLLLASLAGWGVFPMAMQSLIQDAAPALFLLLLAMLARMVLRLRLRHRSDINSERAYGISSLVMVLTQGWTLGVLLAGLAGVPGSGNSYYRGLFIVLAVLLLLFGYRQSGTGFQLSRGSGSDHGFLRILARRAATLSSLFLAFLLLLLLCLLGRCASAEYTTSAMTVAVLVAILISAVLIMQWRFVRSIRLPGSEAPVLLSLAVLATGVLALAVLVYPEVMPGQLLAEQVAARDSRLILMILGMGFLLPALLVYNGLSHLYFRKTHHLKGEFRGAAGGSDAV